MIKKHNVLIFPAGSEIGLEIYSSLKYSHHVNMYGASGKSDHASFIYDEKHYIEDSLFINNQNFLNIFNNILIYKKIEFIYPTHDEVAYFLSKNQSRLSAQVLTSNYTTCSIAKSKNETYKVFRNFDFCPQVHCPPYHDIEFPVFLKPNEGQGGKGVQLVENKDDLEFYLKKDSNLVVTEYLPGEEISVDCFTDFNRELRFIGPRTRERVQMGISFRSTSIALSREIEQIAQSINQVVELSGAWFFQAKKSTNGKFKLLEFSPRQSSTMGLYRYTGINFALLTLFNAQKKHIQILTSTNEVQLDRCLHNRFKSNLAFKHVYIDYDETLVTDGRVHELAMAFLYQCRNQDISITLITKHRHNIEESLKINGISEKIFTNIIHLAEHQEKSSFIEPKSAIFIDNYWYDRKAVKDKLGIPVFDVDGIECLLN